MPQIISKLVFSSVLVLLLLLPISARQAGSLDPTFGTGGTVLHNIQNGGGNAVAVQADGKVILAGSSNVNSTYGFVLVRFNQNGTLDTTFGTNGVVKTQIFAVQDLGSSARDLIIQPDGKIIAVGNAQRGAFIPPGTPVYNEVAVVRYNTNGSLDTTFDTDGIATTLVNGDSGFGFGGELQADDKIVVVDHKFRILRFNANGTLDTNFGTGGFVLTTFGTATTNGEDVKIQPDGKIVVIGGQGLVCVVRLDTDGSFDTTFDGDGKLTASIAGYDRGYGLAIQPDGKMVAVAISQTSSSAPQNLGLMRIMPNGAFDTTFGNGGKTVAPANFGVGLDIALQADGKIITAGIGSFVFSPPNSDFAIARFLSTGAPDTTFDGDGIAIVNIMPEDTARAVVIAPNGKIVVGGYSTGSGTGVHLSAARIHSKDDTFADFDGDGKTDVSIFRPSNGQWWYQRSSNGTVPAYQFGAGTDKMTPGDFTGDGKTDIAFWRPSSGEWFVLRSEDNSYYSFPFGISGDIPTVGDFDGDGKSDAAVFRPSNARWYIRRSSGGTTLQQFGLTGDVPVVADYDGDGKADIAIYRAAEGKWWIQRSAAGVIAYTFGNSSDKPVPGDYTGDGNSDVAFFRPSSGEWFILRSENQSYYSFPFGVSTDTPAPGDYDGDGKFDAAVFRPSNSTWYAKRTTAGTLIQTFGQTGDRPVPNAFVP